MQTRDDYGLEFYFMEDGQEAQVVKEKQNLELDLDRELDQEQETNQTSNESHSKPSSKPIDIPRKTDFQVSASLDLLEQVRYEIKEQRRLGKKYGFFGSIASNNTQIPWVADDQMKKWVDKR